MALCPSVSLHYGDGVTTPSQAAPIVVAGVEDSDHGEAAARAAAEFAGRLDAELRLVHVVNFPKAVYTLFESVPLDTESLAEAERGDVWARIGPVVDGLGIPWRRVDLEGYPPDALAQYANDVGAQLLVVGSRRLGELRSLFLGSTSHRALHLASCDVLVARAREDDDAGG